jgi:hypothetical protein
MSTKAQHRAKVGLPPLVFGPQWADMLRHAYVQPVLSKARQDYMHAQDQKASIPSKSQSVKQILTLGSDVSEVPEDIITRTLDTCDLLLNKPKRKYARKAKVAEVNHE